MDYHDSIKKCRRISAPLVSIETSDQHATTERIMAAANEVALENENEDERDFVAVGWDAARGMVGLNERGDTFVGTLQDEPGQHPLANEPAEFIVSAMERSGGLEDALFVFRGAHHFLKEPDVEAALLNCRNPFKTNGRTMFIVGAGLSAGAVLEQHIVALDEPRPTDEELSAIVRDVYESIDVEPDDDEVAGAVQALKGLSAFPAETGAALAAKKDGIDLDDLWSINRKKLNETPGITVYEGDERFADLGGLDRAKSFLELVISGRKRYSLIVFIDEIEKAYGGSIGDTSGVSQGILQQELKFMQDREVRGLLYLGPPGSGKSALAKAIGNEAGIPCVEYDLGGLKDSLVGSTEHRQREAHRVFDAVSDGDILYVATCNGIEQLPPALRRRFNRGTFFFDLPTKTERKAIWKIYRKKFDVGNGKPIDDEGWTGAEIRTCCEMAWEFECDLPTAAGYIIPISRSAPKSIESLREESHGKYQSASSETAGADGVYSYTAVKESKKAQPKGKRRVNV